jgi:hypothetical protein
MMFVATFISCHEDLKVIKQKLFCWIYQFNSWETVR